MCEVTNFFIPSEAMSQLPGCDIILLDRYECVLKILSNSLKHAKHCVQIIFYFQGRDPAHTLTSLGELHLPYRDISNNDTCLLNPLKIHDVTQ